MQAGYASSFDARQQVLEAETGLGYVRCSNSMNKPRILIAEDEDLQYELYEEALSAYELIRATSGSDALRLISQKPPNLIILDHILAEGELGLDYLPELKEALPYVPI